MVRQYAAEAGRELDGFHWGLNQPTAISLDGGEAMEPGGAQRGRATIRDAGAQRRRHRPRPLRRRHAPTTAPARWRRKIEAGVEHVNVGFLSDDADGLYRQMDLFAETVMPRFS